MRRLVNIFVQSLTGASHTADLAEELQLFIRQIFENFPWPIVITDWTSRSYQAGGNKQHWSGDNFYVQIKTERAGRDILRLDGMRFLNGSSKVRWNWPATSMRSRPLQSTAR